MILDTTHKQGWGYSVLSGQFPHTSARGNKYIFVFYSWDANAILLEPMQSKNGSKMLQVYQHTYEKLEKVGIKPKINIIDNEASVQVCHFITNTLNASYQKVTPHCHQENAAEKFIQTTKHHLIASLASTDLHFPKHQWYDLLPQAEFILNMLQPTSITQKNQPITYLYGEHNYNAVPLVPPGWKVLCFNDLAESQTWAPHGTEGF